MSDAKISDVQVRLVRRHHRATRTYMWPGVAATVAGLALCSSEATRLFGAVLAILGVGALAIYLNELVQLNKEPEFASARIAMKQEKAQVASSVAAAAELEKLQLQKVATASSALARLNQAKRARESKVRELNERIANLADSRGKKLISVPGGITVYERWIATPEISGSIVGVHASSEDNTTISKRITATRIVALGVFALAAKKTKAEGQAYCVFDGPEVAGMAIFQANKTFPAGPQAARLANLINVQAKKAEIWMATKDEAIEAAKLELGELANTPVGVQEEHDYQRLLDEVHPDFRARVK